MTTVIVTRPLGKQNDALQLFKQAGLEVFSAPCFAAETNRNIKAEWLHQSSLAESVVVLNTHAIDACLDISPNFRIEDNSKVLAIGAAVQKRWQLSFGQEIKNAGGDSEAVIRCLAKSKPSSLTVFTALGGRELIKSYALEQRINYCQVNCYTKAELPLNLTAWQTLIAKDQAIVLTANSSAPLHFIQSQLPQPLWQAVIQNPIVTGAKRISDLAIHLGFSNIVTADSPSNQDILKAIFKCTHKKSVG